MEVESVRTKDVGIGSYTHIRFDNTFEVIMAFGAGQTAKDVAATLRGFAEEIEKAEATGAP